MKKLKFTISFILFFISTTPVIEAQMITGVWTGKINRQKVEVKMILKDGSLTGTTCYYQSPDNYLRYSTKGYFDPCTNEAVWWDDELIEENSRVSVGRKTAFLSRADFNCPAYVRMMLGERAPKAVNQNRQVGEGGPDQTDWSTFTDEWDFVLEIFTEEKNDAEAVNRVDQAAAKKTSKDQPAKPSREKDTVIAIPGPTTVLIDFPKLDPAISVMPVEPIKPPGIEEKYVARKKVFAVEIPVSGDSIELHFYDNAQVDGDSISLFLNDKLIFEHIRLTDKAYSIKLAVTELNTSNELIMIAENLGSIPPNTSFMVALVGDKRYDARLESTEGSSALVRLVKTTDQRQPLLIQ